MPLGGEQPLLLILLRTVIAQGLMRTFGVVPMDPCGNALLGFYERVELVLPHTLLLQRAKPALDQPILFRCIRRNKLLRQPIKPAGIVKPPTLKDQAIVTANDGHLAVRSERSKAGQAAMSSARSASLARPRNANSHPTISRL